MKQVLLLLANGFEEYEASAFTDVLGWSRSFGLDKVNVVTAGMHDRLICTWNFTVLPQVKLNEINADKFDALALPGGFGRAGFYEDAYHDDFLEVIRCFYRMNKIIAAVCVGAMPLGKSGILKGKKATTYHLLNGLKRRQLGEFGALVQDESIVVDGNIITSTGPATAVEVAFILLEMLTTIENTNKIKNLMGFMR